MPQESPRRQEEAQEAACAGDPGCSGGTRRAPGGPPVDPRWIPGGPRMPQEDQETHRRTQQEPRRTPGGGPPGACEKQQKLVLLVSGASPPRAPKGAPGRGPLGPPSGAQQLMNYKLEKLINSFILGWGGD